jgi:hypothetical protein
MRKAGVSPSHPLIIEEEDRHVPSKGRAEMIPQGLRSGSAHLSFMRRPDAHHSLY